ncbi:MAG TPA: hypothetical protein PK926_05795 [Spirochaetota bacterium]|nr:hypothetical protein [Spirochaetota bacterium]HPI87723.1 hypothetical protein [Spirochaetota bacterium]HPR48152.1 hypothetical protein [Spirochaetota bacterium]
MKRTKFFFVILLINFTVFFACTDDKGNETAVNPAVTVHDPSEEATGVNGSDINDEGMEINYTSLLGKWKLLYSGNYGYYFSFQKNYKTLVTLYLGNEALVFKGVHSIDAGNIVINIYEMKREKNLPAVNYYRGFQKANSSSFIFKASLHKKNGKKILKIIPVKIRIDGNDSDGYFEPLIKLNYSGK